MMEFLRFYLVCIRIVIDSFNSAALFSSSIFIFIPFRDILADIQFFLLFSFSSAKTITALKGKIFFSNYSSSFILFDAPARKKAHQNPLSSHHSWLFSTNHPYFQSTLHYHQKIILIKILQ
jgi:hypothetical protein